MDAYFRAANYLKVCGEIPWRRPIASQLPAMMGEKSRGRIVVAHLGSGASLCLLENLRSVDTSMGYTPAGGIPMGTRSGDLDPGVMLELARRHDHAALSPRLSPHGIARAVRRSEQRYGDAAGKPQRDGPFCSGLFCRQVRAAKAGGIDALVFSGGIGEHAPQVRTRICEPLRFLGFALDAEANRDNQTSIHAQGSKPVLRITANEEDVIRDLVGSLLSVAS